MKEVIRIIICLVPFLLWGCGSDTNRNEECVIESNEETKEKVQLPENKMNSNYDAVGNSEADVENLEEKYYENVKLYMQSLVDSAYIGIDRAIDNENCIVYGEEDFVECRNFETNMVLDFCGEKMWQRPAYSMDEYEVEKNFDKPLGKYEFDEKYGDYEINHYYGAKNFEQEKILSIISLIKKKKETDIEQIRFYLMNRGAADVMTYTVQQDYNVETSFKDMCDNSILERYIGDDSTNIWYWFNGEDMEFICDMDISNYTDYTYEYSLYVHCQLENGRYTVDEVLPLKMQ